MPTVIFCRDPLEPRKPDPAFEREAQVAQACAMPLALVDHDMLERRDAITAVKRIPEGNAPAVYRGWMLRTADYCAFHDALAAKGHMLVNTPEQYAACHHAPEAHPYVARWTTKMACVSAANMDDETALNEAIAVFGASPLVLKDWVKSQAQGYWTEACFIPDASDIEQVRRIVDRFVALQGDSLVGGLVFRAYTPLAREAGEWRAFVLDGRLIGCWRREQGEGQGPPASPLSEIALNLPSRFATMDFARRTDGSWLLIETGDGQVSEIPASADPREVFEALAHLA